MGRRSTLAIAVVMAALASGPAAALDIEGVQPAALDQPRVNVLVQRAAGKQILVATVDGQRTANVEAFLDTGASSSVLSFHTVNELGVVGEKTTKGNPVRFSDVGLGGESQFAVSEPLLLSIGPSNSDPDIPTDARSLAVQYPVTSGPVRTEIGPLTQSNDLLASLAVADLDVVGEPVIGGRVIVMDMSGVNRVSDKIHTTLVDPRNKSMASLIPPTKLHVKLSHANFAAFTKIAPAGADGPTLASNPFIGPAPVTTAGSARQNDAASPPAGGGTSTLLASFAGKSIAGSWLLDSGAVSSMISQKNAAALGIHYDPKTVDSDHPRLLGISVDKQFTMSVAGVGGAGRHAAGFFLDTLVLRTTEGEPLRFVHAPVLVTDITLKDQTDGHLYTLDGVLGMNFLTASAKLDTSALLPDVTNLTAGAFRYVVIDERAGILGVTPN